jgi:valyl-tRNA synthetase
MNTANIPADSRPTELSKTYDPAAVEAEMYEFWLKHECFKADPAKPGEPYSIVIPPPNVTGALHLGHAINNTLQDILTRVHRMRGFNTVWIPGIDHAGIATQAVVERTLKEQENKTRHDVGRDGLVERIWAWKQQYGDRILSQLQRLGCSCDWSRTRFTLDEMCAKAVRETFFKLFRDGLVYRGKRLVNWDTHLQTSISDDEIYHEEVKTFLWHIRYRIVRDSNRDTGLRPVPAPQTLRGLWFADDPSAQRGPEARVTDGARQDFVAVATTRPETLLGDTAVAVHSEDPRWNWAIGMEVELPLTGRRIPIIADDILVNREFGSGVVKVTPAHDPNDYAVYQRHLGQPDAIDIINLMNPDGTLNAAAGPAYAGLTMAAARKKVIADLGDALIKEEPYETQVGHSDRSKTAIQPYLSDQWFVKMAPLAEPALDVVRDGTIKFFPERHAQQYLSWLGEKRDWPISRQLWWGHRIPVWTKQIEASAEFKTGAEKHRGGFAVLTTRDGDLLSEGGKAWGFAKGMFNTESGIGYHTVCLLDGEPEAERALGEQGYIQDPDVLDTWFSSALWPHSTLGWPDHTADLVKWYPTSVLLTGRDIITLWVARMVMMGLYNMNDPRSTGVPPVPSDARHGRDARATAIPFHHVMINPTILDGKGERMSKSKGNGVDPVDIIEAYGADALRFTLTQMATETQDVRMPVKKNAAGKNTSEKFDAGRNFCTKLWNAARFALSNLSNSTGVPASAGTVLSLQDRWIISRFNQAVHDTNQALTAYRFDQYAKAIYDFFWRDFCDWYVEAAKPAMKDPARSGATSTVLAAVLDGVLRLMHPAIPFITEKIWHQLNIVRPNRGIPGLLECPPSDKLIAATWPAAGPIDHGAEHVFPRLQAVVTVIRNVRNQYKIDPKKPVTVRLSVLGQEAIDQTDQNREMIELMGACTIHQIGSDLPAPANSARGVGDGFDVYLLDLIDPNAEAQRTAKHREELIKKAGALRARLANPAYADKAPAHLVRQTRDELAAVEAELAKSP